MFNKKRKKNSVSLIAFFLMLAFPIVAQQNKIDSLRAVIKTAVADTNKVITLNALTKQLMAANQADNAKLCANEAAKLSQLIINGSSEAPIIKTAKRLYSNAITNLGILEFNVSNYDKALEWYHTALKVREEIADKNGIAVSYNNIANVFSVRGNYPEALKNQHLVLKLREEIKAEHPADKVNKRGLAASYVNIGSVYWNQGNYPEAQKMYLSGLKLFEELADLQNTASCYDGLGIVYYAQGNYQEALKNQLKALEIKKENDDKFGISSSYLNIGGIYEAQGNYKEALHNYELSLKIREEIGDQQGIATAFSNIGVIYSRLGNFDSAISNLKLSVKILEEIADQQGIACASNNIGDAYVKRVPLQQSDLNQAISYFNKGLELSKLVGSKEDIKTSFWGLSEAYEKKASLNRGNPENWKMAHAFYRQYIVYRDSLLNEENTRKTVQAQMNYEFDKKEATAREEQAKKDTLAFEEKRKQKVIIICVSIGLLLVVVFAIYVFRSLKVTNARKHIIQQQKEIVEEKQKEVLDSIHYARRIQRSILPTEVYITKTLQRLKK
jgi:tetratricopeptide (TPR) repeat protein